MKVSGKQILLVVMLATVRGTTVNRRSTAAAPDFAKALKIVEEAASQPGNINYDTFCADKGQGAFKLGCQIKEMKDVGLLVCLESADCEFRLQQELIGLNIIKVAGLKVLEYDTTIIKGLKCGKRNTTDVGCFGYLVEWIAADQGQGKSLRSEIKKGNIEGLTKWVKEYQPNQSARSVTSNDLKKIVKFMTPSPGKYERICDLQGFFMKIGGFMIADPDGVVSNEPANYTCYDINVYPTTQQVIDDLTKMANELSIFITEYKA